MATENVKAEEIFHEAIEVSDPGKRSAYLDKACGEDSELRTEVEALLRAHEEAGDFLKAPALAPDATLEESLIEGPGTRVGRYELLEMIGEGGMGLVYLAEQKEPVRRRVALKIIKPGMDSKQVIARFETERQVLALLDHPNIARVFDAGTTEAGRPYFVMEYVKGMSITRYCDREKLGIEKRLKLFSQVCYAVQHAHQKGIIHRDIKPSNILVSVQDDRAMPKIIDFGVAKAVTQPLTEHTLFTKHGQLLGTPEYMSPEQTDIGNRDIDTRADIYSLGVVLYELLTGVLPFERDILKNKGFIEVQRILTEAEPPHPSIRLTSLGAEAKKIAERRHTQVVTLARRLHRELEWIPLKAMRKDRSRRYRSASELADDIRNYLDGAPLLAGPETAVYRVKKFVQKHAGSVATVVLVIAAIVLGLVVSSTMYFRAEKALEKEAVARGVAEEARGIAEQAEKVAEERGEEYRHLSYVHGVALADAAYRDGNIRRVRELLESCPEDLRGWEWYRLNHIQDQALMTLRGHEGGVGSIALSPNGKRIISASGDKTIKVWDAATGTELMTLRGHEDSVASATLSPNGERIVSGDYDGIIKVWDASTGDELKTLRGHQGAVYGVAFSPDGRRIISWSEDKTIKVWDAASGDEIMTIRAHEYDVLFASFSPDGQRIVSGGGDGNIKIWDAATGAEVMTLRGHIDSPYSVVFSLDGKKIVSGSLDKTIKIWDATTGTELKTLHGHEGGVNSVVLSSDGKRIVSGSWDNTIKVWDAVTGAEILTLHGHEEPITCVAFGPDGERIVSGSWDKMIKVWDPSLDRERMTFPRGHQSWAWVVSVAFSPDGRRVISGSRDKTIKLWDAASGAEVMTLRGHDGCVSSVSFSPDGQRIVSGSRDKTIKLWDVASGDEMMTLRGHEDFVNSVAISPDSRRIISGSLDNTIKVWDATSGAEEMTLRGHDKGVGSIAFSPDGKRIVSGSYDKTIKVWDISTGAEVMTLRGHEAPIGSVSFSPDGKRLVTASADSIIKVWDAATGAEVMTLRGHYGPVNCVAFAPDGKRIVSSSALVGTAKVWDVETGAELMTLRGQGLWFFSIAFSPDGKTIAIASSDGITLLESAAPAGGYGPRRTGTAARGIVDELYEKHGLYQKVIDELKADEALDEAVHKVALQIANSRLWEDGAGHISR